MIYILLFSYFSLFTSRRIWNKQSVQGCKHGKVDNLWSLPSVSKENVFQNYTLTLNFVKKKKILNTLKTYWSTSQANYDDKKYSKKCLHNLEDSASGGQVGDIEQVIV